MIENYIPPYNNSDIGTIIDRLVEDYIIEGDYDGKDYDELETIIGKTMKQFNEEILKDEEIEDDIDYESLKEDMYQSIQDSIIENYSKAIKE